MKAIGYLQPKAIDQQDALVDIDLPTPQASGRDLLLTLPALSG